MKLLVILMLCTFAAAAPNVKKHDVLPFDSIQDTDVQTRSLMINALIRMLFETIRNVIDNGSTLFGIPPLDPLELDHYHLVIPAGLINLDLELKNVVAVGLGGFVVHSSDLQLSDLSFDLDISIPFLQIKCDVYVLNGDILTAIPIYGNGGAEFIVENFRIKGKLFLKQSDNEKSVIIDRIEGAGFEIPSLKSNIDGAIGGGDIDKIVNVIIEEVVMGYVARFHGAITALVTEVIISVGNPLLELLDTWKYIAALL